MTLTSTTVPLPSEAQSKLTTACFADRLPLWLIPLWPRLNLSKRSGFFERKVKRGSDVPKARLKPVSFGSSVYGCRLMVSASLVAAGNASKAACPRKAASSRFLARYADTEVCPTKPGLVSQNIRRTNRRRRIRSSFLASKPTVSDRPWKEISSSKGTEFAILNSRTTLNAAMS